ncbi:MAG: alpha/beta fold hydrolase [Nocardioides sp.]
MTRAWRRRPVRLVASLLALAFVAGVVGVAIGSTGDDLRVSEVELDISVGAEPSGETVALDASVFAPEGEGRRAAVVLAHGFGGSKDDLEGQARELAADGYVVLTYSARGFGESGGLIHLNSPDYEIADVSALLDLLAGRDDVQLDGDGDPRVGIAGGSYGGAVALMAAAYDDRVDAIVPAITWNDLGRSLFPQSAVSDDPGVFKRRWASLFFASGLAGGEGSCGRFDPEVCALYDESATSGRPTQAVLDLLRRSSPGPVLDQITAPSLIIAGQQDSLFPLGEADANAKGIAAGGTPVAMRWIDGGHDGAGGPGLGDDLTNPALAWFDHYLRDGEDPGTAFEFSLPTSPFEEDAPEPLTAPAYPLDGPPDEQVVSLEGEEQPVFSPPGGEPTAVTGLPGTGGVLGLAAGVSGAGYALAVLPGESAVFETAPLDQKVTVVGSPQVRLIVTSSSTDATLFASAWVVASDGSATLPRQLVSPVRLDGLVPGEPREVDVALPASAYDVEQGQRLRVVVSSTDAAYAVPLDSRGYRIGLADAALRLPLVPAERISGVASLVPVPLVVAVGVLLLMSAAGALWSRRRRRPASVAEDLEDVPLVVDGLVKAYPSGLRAVDGVSWRAERGQVVGLLGPNGAGKTTTMRMLVGLIRADSGRIHVLGHEVTAGAPVLSRVGALIEGPGFLPHLTGRQNLHAYWAATGRAEDEAGFDDALAIADLGVAADRPVKSYSHGMSQRLGIAQAMLGQPELLLLDEPTNGLDPPQIRAMRGVLARYAASGRTVVVSSHLLSEVEQTCSHVVVMHRGRVVLEGAVADLVEGSESTLIAVGDADPYLAARVLAALDEVSDAEVDADGRVHVRGTAQRPVLVAELVAHRVPVSSVDGRRHLEEVFMGLVGDGEPAQIDPAEVSG